MRIVVFSDSHNEFFAIKRILDLNQGRADLFLHLGDGNREFEDIRDLYPGCAFLGVAGNCDRLCREKGEREFTEGGVRILMTHGHAYGVKNGLSSLVREAEKRGIGLVPVSYTHLDDGFHADGALTINGGTISILQSYEGLEGSTVEINGGDIQLTASDDGVNAAGGSYGDNWDSFRADGSHFVRITGGTLWVDAQGDEMCIRDSYISSSVGFCYRNGREIQISLLLFFKTVVY